MNKQLPERPDLGQLKKQAKDLLDEIRDGKAEALTRAQIETANPDAIDAFALHDAQRVVAREYGFASWAKLKLHVETRTIDAAEARSIEAALDGEAESVAAILAERPALATRSIFAAAVLGEASWIVTALQREPALATNQGGPRGWVPLLYVCFGKCGGGDRERTAAAQALLANGADANASWLHVDWPESPLPALYGATGVNDFPELARVLLRAGANPNDGESRYHAAEHNHVECLEVLAEFGADFSGTDKTWGNTPLYFLLGHTHPAPATLAGVRWLLEHGANPNVPSQAGGVAETALHAAVQHDWPVETVERLLRHGADPARTRADGRTAYALAVAGGRDAVAAVLRAHGGAGGISPVDEFLGCCMRADEGAAREKLRENPTLMDGMPAQDRMVVLVAAREGRAAAVETMAGLGFDLNIADGDGARPLHSAAWQGEAATVRALLAHGAQPEVRDRRFNALPIGWCAHGSMFCGNPSGDYAAAVEAFIAAGVFVPPDTEGSPAVMAVLKRHGFGRKRPC